MDEPIDNFRVSPEITIRAARPADLPALEWWGWFSAQRGILQAAFDAHERGDGLFLAAESGGFPIAQAWLDFKRGSERSRAVLWAVRVLPGFQGLGIGTRLIAACEAQARGRRFGAVEIGVEKDNARARALYERLGYQLVGEYKATERHTRPEGRPLDMRLDQWLLEKRL